MMDYERILDMLKFRIGACILAAAVFTGTSAGAQLLSVQYDAVTGNVTVKGNTNGRASLTILPGELDRFDTSAVPAAFDAVSASGDWRCTVGMPDSCANGKYTVFVSDEKSQNEYITFDYIKAGSEEANEAAEKKIDELYKQIAAATPEDAWNILYNNDDILGVPQSLFEDVRLSEKIKNEMMRLLSSMDNARAEVKTQGGFEKFIDKLKLMAAIRTANGVTGVQEAMTKTFAAEAKYLLDGTSYYTDKTAVGTFENLIDARSRINKPGDLKDVFDEAAKKAYDALSGGTGGGAAGGGATSSGSGIVSGTPSGNTGIQKDRFWDLPKSHWAYEPVNSMADKGIISGYEDGSFAPSASITRAEFATMAVKAFGISGGSADFADVAPGAWYADYVGAAYAAGIISGYDGRFMPQDNISRQDAALIIYRALGLERADGAAFADGTSIADYAREAVDTLSSAGILKGSDGYFYPQNTITRAEAAQLFYAALK